jgi:hypothetical protein
VLEGNQFAIADADAGIEQIEFAKQLSLWDAFHSPKILTPTSFHIFRDFVGPQFLPSRYHLKKSFLGFVHVHVVVPQESHDSFVCKQVWIFDSFSFEVGRYSDTECSEQFTLCVWHIALRKTTA